MAEFTTRPVTWRGEPFPCIQVDTDIQNSLVITTYPHRKGQHVLNLGGLGDAWEVQAVFSPSFNGRGPYADDLWPFGYLRFLDACRAKERGYFDHPRLGTAWAQCANVRISDNAAEFSKITATFVEANLDDPTYTTRLTIGGGGAGEQDGLIRARNLDVLMSSTFSLSISVFEGFWVDFSTTLYSTNRVLSMTDVVVALNLFHASITATVETYGIMDSALYWELQYEISMLRIDAVMMAHRFAQSQDKRIVSYELRATMSSLELAVLLYGDPGRATEIERLNHVYDPLFMPPGTYLVMSE